MPWNMGDLEDRTLLDDFDAECIEAGFVEGYIPADRTRSGKPVVSRQLLLVWRPLDEEAKDQPSWYSMGGKEFQFGGKTKTIELGGRTFELYPEVIEGPKLAKSSRMGLLIDRLLQLGVQPEGAKANWFVGLKAHLKRERYEASGRSTLEVERETLMPVKLLERAKKEVPEEGIDEALINIVVGYTDRDIPEQAKILELPLSKVFGKLDALVREGRLIRDKNGVYREGNT